jgi:hypothetical protein
MVEIEAPANSLTPTRVNGLYFFEAGDVLDSAETVTSTSVPFLSLTSSPCSSVNAFSIRSSRYPRSGPSTVICAFSGLLGLEEGIILPTVPGNVVLDCSGIRVVSAFSSAIFADRAIRGFANSFVMLASDALPIFFLAFLCNVHPP